MGQIPVEVALGSATAVALLVDERAPVGRHVAPSCRGFVVPGRLMISPVALSVTVPSG
jgi:hypothetical protein